MLGPVIHGSIRWAHDLHHRADIGTILEPSLIIAPDRYTKLSRLDPDDGRVMWTADVRGPWGWLAGDGVVCAYLNQHSFLECFDAVTGAQRWAVELSGRRRQIFGRLLVAGDVIITGGWRRGYSDLIAVSVSDGTVTWTLPTADRLLAAPVPGPEGTVLLPFPEERQAWLVETATGGIIAELLCPARGCAWTGTDFIGTDERGCVIALDLHGDMVELVRHETGIATTVPVVADDLILFEDERGMLSAYRLATGLRLWQDPIHHRRGDLLPAATLATGQLAIGTSFGQLRIYDPDGRLTSKRTYGKRFYADLAATPSGTILAAIDGRIISIQ